MITTQCLPTAPAVYEEVLCLYFHHPATPEISTLSLHDALPISVGNPHAVVEGDPDDLPLIGPLLETHPRFPERTNVQVARLDEPGEITARVWERGVGETTASGTSAVAVAAALGQDPATVRFPGGELEV